MEKDIEIIKKVVNMYIDMSDDKNSNQAVMNAWTNILMTIHNAQTTEQLVNIFSGGNDVDIKRN